MSITVTLAKLNTIRNMIEDRVLPRITAEVNKHQTTSFIGFETVEEMSKMFTESAEKVCALIDQRDQIALTVLKLRKLIAYHNEKDGVGAIMADYAFFAAEMDFWALVLRQASISSKSPAEIKKLLDYERETPKPQSYGSPAKVSYSVVSDTFNVEYVSGKLAEVEKKLRHLKEQRNEKNHQILITLDDEVAKVLETLDLL